MKPVLLFIGLSIILIGSIMVVFFYPNFSKMSDEKTRLELIGAPNYPYLSEYYTQVVFQYKQSFIALIGGIVLLIMGLGVTIYGATTKKEIGKEIANLVNLAG